jgi:hypothetical protein
MGTALGKEWDGEVRLKDRGSEGRNEGEEGEWEK